MNDKLKSDLMVLAGLSAYLYDKNRETDCLSGGTNDYYHPDRLLHCQDWDVKRAREQAASKLWVLLPDEHRHSRESVIRMSRDPDGWKYKVHSWMESHHNGDHYDDKATEHEFTLEVCAAFIELMSVEYEYVEAERIRAEMAAKQEATIKAQIKPSRERFAHAD